MAQLRSAPPFQWVWHNPYDYYLRRTYTAVATDQQGQFYVAGLYNSRGRSLSATVQLPAPNPIGPYDSTDAYIACYDTAGTALWAIPVIGRGEAITKLTIAPNGELYCVGKLQSDTISLGPLQNIRYASSVPGSRDGFVARISATGQPLWMKRFASQGQLEELKVGVDASGRTTIAGIIGSDSPAEFRFDSSHSIYLPPASTWKWWPFVVSYDQTGGYHWSHLFDSASHSTNGLSVGPGGTVYLAGTGNQFSQLDGLPLFPTATNWASSVGFVTAFDTAGTLEWARPIGTAGRQAAEQVLALPSGDYVVTGRARDSAVTIGNQRLTGLAEGDAVVVSFAASGQPYWVRALPGWAWRFNSVLATDPTNATIYTAGYITRPNHPLLAGIPYPIFGRLNAFVAALDADDGNFQWVKTFGSRHGADEVPEIASSPNGLFVLGYVSSPINMPDSVWLPPLAIPHVYPSSQPQGGFLARLGPAGRLTISAEVDGTIPPLVSWPNPIRVGQSLQLSAHDPDAAVVLFDALGRPVRRAPNARAPFLITDLPSGLYLLRVGEQEQRIVIAN